VLVAARGADIDDPGLAAGVLLQADHLGRGPDRVAGIDRAEPARLGVAEVRHRVQRDIRHRFAEDDVKRGEIVERAFRQAAGAGEFVGGIERVPRGIERVVKRPFPARDRARHRVLDHVADAVILEEAAGIGLVEGRRVLGHLIDLRA
jgi:hypothetical protein